MSFFYAYRGWILGGLAGAMLALPGAPVCEAWAYEALPLSGACFVAFVILRIFARRTIGEHTRGFTHDADRLVKDGVYARIRHPLYLSNAGIGYAFIILHFGFSLVALPFVATLFAFEFLLSRMEDRYLENRFGNEWRDWAAVTPAFFPRAVGGFARRLASGKSDFKTNGAPGFRRSFVAAFKADAATWFWLVFGIALVMARKFVG